MTETVAYDAGIRPEDISITAAAGKYELTASFLGYTAKGQALDLSSSRKVNIEMQEEGAKLETVIITEEREEEARIRSRSQLRRGPRGARGIGRGHGE